MLVGTLSGGAQCTGEVMRTPSSSKASPACSLTGCDAMPTRCRLAKSHSPLRSPVNIRPVRLAPLAAGARPTISPWGLVLPKAATGRPQ